MSHPNWVSRFMYTLPSNLREKAATWTDLERVLSSRIESAQKCWPGLTCNVEEFIKYLAEKLASQITEIEHLTQCFIEDLYLAYACICREAAALQEFHRAFSPRNPSLEEEEVWQLACIKLFVGQTPKIAEYNGSGPLKKWLKIVLLRTKIDWSRNQAKHTKDHTDEQALSAAACQAFAADPELNYLKKSSQHDFVKIMTQALRSLSDKEYELLSQHWLLGWSLEQLAAHHGIHRATAARWLERGRTRWLTICRELLIRRLGSPDRVYSLWPFLCSQFSFRMSQLLHEAAKS